MSGIVEGGVSYGEPAKIMFIEDLETIEDNNGNPFFVDGRCGMTCERKCEVYGFVNAEKSLQLREVTDPSKIEEVLDRCAEIHDMGRAYDETLS